MQLSFITPVALWLLLVLPLLWWLALAVPRRLSPLRFWSSLGIRTLMIVLLIFALAGVQLVRPVRQMTTVFVLDASDSLSASARGQAEAFVADALKAMPSDDQAAVVVFGENALVERSPGTEQTFSRIESQPDGSRTNLEQALSLSMALLPAETQKRVVLLSDGGQNSGDALEAAQLAAARGVAISYVDLSVPDGSEALIEALDAPSSVRLGQEIVLTAQIASSEAQQATLQIYAQGTGADQLLTEQQVQLQPGENRYSVTVTAETPGFQRFKARIIPTIDGRAQNNQAETLVQVQGAPRVLIVANEPAESQNLQAALAAASVSADLVTPQSMPSSLTALSDYDAVFLLNVAATSLPLRALAVLPAYVRELGRGLVMVGGDHSYGVGGYGNTPLEEALPVYMDVRSRESRPDIALMFVIDKSGSMDACHCSGPNRQSSSMQRSGTPKIDIAKDAVIQASALLSPRDTIGVVAFDGTAHWILTPERVPGAEALQNALAPVAPDGSTNVRQGLLAAQDALLKSDAKLKHVILLTDGWSSGSDNLDLARQMSQNNITLSVVAAGGGSADYLNRLALAGSGRYYPAQTMDEVPQLFVQETITIAGTYMIEGAMTPQYGISSPILDGLMSGVPQLYGYNGTTAKETASSVLADTDGAPILAQWQYGLGRSVAWTSDLTGKWAKDWVQWSQFPRFAAQLVAWVLPTSQGRTLSAEAHAEGSQVVIEVRSSEEDPDLAVSAAIVDASGAVQNVLLQHVAAGRYQASIASPPQGSYLVQIVGRHAEQLVEQQTVALSVPYSAEYRQGQSNPALLAALADLTGGSLLENPADAFLPAAEHVSSAREIGVPLLWLALALLSVEIGIRRLSLVREDVLRLRKLPMLPSARVAASSSHAADRERLERLTAARNRARRRARGDDSSDS